MSFGGVSGGCGGGAASSHGQQRRDGGEDAQGAEGHGGAATPSTSGPKEGNRPVPTGLAVVSACKGVIRFVIEVQGRSAHSAKPEEGINALTIGSALIAHFAVGDGPEAWGFAAGTGVLWGFSYFFWRRLEAMPASA